MSSSMSRALLRWKRLGVARIPIVVLGGAALLGVAIGVPTAAAVTGAQSDVRSFAAPVASETPTPKPSPTPEVRFATVTETAPVAFDRVQVDDATLAAGTTAVTTAGVDGELTRVYRVTYTDDVETGRELQTETVSRAPIAEVTSRGTYVAPPPPRYVAPAPAPAAPAPAPPASTGGTVNPGGYCGNVGATGVAANGKTYTCGAKGPDANGKYHWNA